MWEKLRSSLTIEGVGKPTSNAALDAFEKSYGFVFPKSYREFVRVFGPGELGEYVRIYAPGSAVPSGDLERFVKLIRKVSDTLIETFGNAVIIKRIMPFADTIGGDVIAWDPERVTNKPLHECEILLFPDEGGKPVIVSSNFTDFVDVCLSKAFGKIIKSKSWQPKRTFRPFID